MTDDSGRVTGALKYEDEGYAMSGKIMLSAIVILFAVIVLMAGLHLYARWYLLRARERIVRRRRRSRNHLVFYVEPAGSGGAAAVPSRGLDDSLLKSLPVFAYSSRTHPETMDCAVCLSEFEENEKGRVLPKCSHSFHIECIDMWFHSHSTCPLCRTPVDHEAPAEIVISVGEPVGVEAGSGSGLCSECQHEDHVTGSGRSDTGSGSSAGTTSLGDRRKQQALVGVRIEVPRRCESFGRSETELGLPSPAFRSPGSRILSLKRILSRAGLSPSSAPSCSSASEFDLERGRDETQQRMQPLTPR